MFHRIFASIAAAFCLFGPTPALAQETDACADCIAAEAARDDLQTLYSKLRQEHVDLFARRSQEEYDAHFDWLMASIEGPVPRPEFNLIVQNAMAFGRIGHAKTEAPLGDAIAHVQAGGSIIPLSIVYRGDAMVTDNWTSAGGDELAPGSRIVSLGGLDIAAFEERMRPLVSADSDRLMRSQIEMMLPAYLYLLFGPVDKLAVGFIAPDGEAREQDVAAMGLGEMYAMQSGRALPRPARDPSERLYRDMGNSVFYLQPGPFFALEKERTEDGGDYEIGPFRAFVEEAFAALSQSGACDLVIDLRNNPGGDASFSDLIIARLTDRPYHFASRYEIRAGDNTKEIWADRDGDDATLSGRIANAIRAAQPGERIEIELPLVQPIASDAFRGRVWVLVDKHSYSNAAVMAAFMQDAGIATIAGEETADLPTTYGAVERFTLPNSGAVIIYPKAYMVRPSGDESVRGVVPDFFIAPNPVGESRDIMLDILVTQAAATD